MKKGVKILIAVIILLLIIQLPIFNPAKNYTEADPVNAITTVYEVPMDVQMHLYNACFDCHSNYSKYPWYYHIQPVSWWMSSHIKDAKRHLNFSEFATYSPKRAAHKFHEIYEEMERQSMPIESYKVMHGDVKLSNDDYKAVADWAKKMHDQLEAKIDSVQRKV